MHFLSNNNIVELYLFTVPPIIIKSPVPYLKVDEGSSLELNCLATGNPPPQVTWKVFSNPLLKDDKTDQKLLSIYDAFSGLGVRKLSS